MDVKYILTVFACIDFFHPALSSRWSASIQMVHDPENFCKKSRRIRGKQAEICRNEPELVREIIHGINRAKKECQYQFRFKRWNCTSSRRSLKKVMRQDIMETGFVNALAAAGVTHSITQACSLGNILSCACDRRISAVGGDSWEWGGCGDDVQFGYQRSKDFMDSRWHRRRHDLKTQTLLHNYEAGRLAITKKMQKKCKCHGLSGSCQMKTCWRKMPPFDEVGDRLEKKFNSAVQVMAGNDGKTFLPLGATIKPPDDDDVVYSEQSPDFCKPNRRLGSLGTRNRICNLESQGLDGCDLLCCFRGKRIRQVRVQETCNCTLQCCFKIKCLTCPTDKEIATCK